MEDDVLSALEQVNQRLDYIEEHILSMSKAGARVPASAGTRSFATAS
jgi:hypothetical protein